MSYRECNECQGCGVTMGPVCCDACGGAGRICFSCGAVDEGCSGRLGCCRELAAVLLDELKHGQRRARMRSAAILAMASALGGTP